MRYFRDQTHIDSFETAAVGFPRCISPLCFAWNILHPDDLDGVTGPTSTP